MTIAELAAACKAALERGLPPETTVVIESPDGDLDIVDYAGDPSAPNGYDLWFTLTYGDIADSRFTPGGMP